MSVSATLAASNDRSNCADIFLNHSGQQKHFVEYVYLELQRANHIRVFFDLDTEGSLPKGSLLLDSIMDAIKHCQLGVVVVSQAFITSFWPMLELQHIVAEWRINPKKIIFPIFYDIQPGELTKESNLKKWKKYWKQMVNQKHKQLYPVDTKAWPQALQHIKSLAGLVIPSTEISRQVRLAVSHICKLLPPPSFYGDPFIKGKEYIAENIESHYESIIEDNTKPVASSTLVLGISGVGGSGKTTVCKTMVDFYNRNEFYGRSFLLQLPTKDIDIQQFLKQLKILLKHITSTNRCLIKGIVHIDQAISVLREARKYCCYFVAIDNVLEWSRHYAEQILGALISNYVCYGMNKVIVTSRIKVLLASLIYDTESKLMEFHKVISVPTLKREDAIAALLTYSGHWMLYNSNEKSYKLDLECLVDLCFLSEGLHPLLLQTFGNILKQLIGKNGCGWKQCINKLKSTWLNSKMGSESQSIFDGEIDRNVLRVLKANYRCLEGELKTFFIDIAMLYQRSFYQFNQFCMLYKERDFETLKMQVLQLENFGLVRVIRSADERISLLEIHDLYRAIADREAKANGHYLVFLDGAPSIVPSSLSKVTRMVNYSHMKVNSHHCRQRTAINATNLDAIDLSGLALDRMQHCDLQGSDMMVLLDKLKGNNVTSISSVERILNALSNVIGVRQYTSPNNVLGLRNVFSKCISVLKLKCGNTITRIEGLESAENLLCLELTCCSALKEIKGMHNLETLQELTIDATSRHDDFVQNKHLYQDLLDIPKLYTCSSLTKLAFRGFGKLRSLTDLNCPLSLQELDLQRNYNLEDVDDIGTIGGNLVKVDLSYCESITEFPDVTLRKLRSLMMDHCGGLQVVMPGGVLSDQTFPCLEYFSLLNCKTLEIFPPIQKTCGLRTLLAGAGRYDFDIKELLIRAPNISSLDITVSREQFFLYNQHTTLSGVEELYSLSIKLLAGFENTQAFNVTVPSLSFLSELQSLRKLNLKDFDFIKDLHELSCLRYLDQLYLEGFISLEYLPQFSSLKDLRLENCTSIKLLPYLPASLHSLVVIGCSRLQNLQSRLSSFTSLSFLVLDYISGGSAAMDLSCLTLLNKLVLQGFPASSLLNVEWPDALRYLDLLNSSSLDEHGIPGFASLKLLKELCFWDCISDKSLSGVSCPTSLEVLGIYNCISLEETPDLSNLVKLKKIWLMNCGSLKYMPGCSSINESCHIEIEGCEFLETLIAKDEVRVPSSCPITIGIVNMNSQSEERGWYDDGTFL